jgi:hypothetical protein
VLIAAGLAPAWLIMKMTALKRHHPCKFHQQAPKADDHGLTKAAKPK